MNSVPCQKHPHATKQKAAEHLTRIKSGRSYSEGRVYWCLECLAFHIGRKLAKRDRRRGFVDPLAEYDELSGIISEDGDGVRRESIVLTSAAARSVLKYTRKANPSRINGKMLLVHSRETR